MTDAETEDVAMDEFYNDSAKRLKLVYKDGPIYERQEFKINKPTKGKK